MSTIRFGPQGAFVLCEAVKGLLGPIRTLVNEFCSGEVATLSVSGDSAPAGNLQPLRQVPGGRNFSAGDLRRERMSARELPQSFRGIQKSNTGEDWVLRSLGRQRARDENPGRLAAHYLFGSSMEARAFSPVT